MIKSDKESEVSNFKYHELRLYSSTEWLADNRKKYRQVFDRHSTSYIYAELSFYNKLFDRESWEVTVDLKCYAVKRNNREMCSLNIKRKVSKYDPVVYVREGWGNKREGVFWKRGTYYWEAFIDGQKVASKYFYVEDAGMSLSSDHNPFLELESLKLYEGQYDDVAEGDRSYYSKFSSEETRYIYADIVFQNKNLKSDWQCELFTKYYNQARELKGQIIRLQQVKKEDDRIRLTAGWGSNVKGSWRKGHYSVELVFMDQLLAVLPFEVGDEFEEGVGNVQFPVTGAPGLFQAAGDFNGSFDELMGRLDELIGLEEIKKQVRDHARYIRFLKLRKKKGFKEKENINVHSVFIGNPGTGKTTVAKMMGKLYKRMGLLSKGHVHEVDRVDLVGEYIGQTAPKVKETIEKARGGVLFIDEAYALARANDDTKDFGREVIEILVKEMSNGKGDLAVIVAGYPKEMKYFLDSNPGLKSRFKHHFKFDDYLPQELQKIARFAAAEKEVVLSPEAEMAVDKIIVDAYRERSRSFGNARFVYDLIEKAKINLGLRVMTEEGDPEITIQKLETVLPVDVEKINFSKIKQSPKIPIDEKLLEESLVELNSLIGMENIKREIGELVDLVRYYHLVGKDVLNKLYLHTLFVGNPGTGKTTVARILTRIYKALGILERGHMVETDRQGLVAGFVGQTALKTAEKIEEAHGGVLFIDEAYSLNTNQGSSGDFGNEVIQTILKRMEDNRGMFFVFAAGYPENMEAFLKANPGLHSRFEKTLKFEDYSPEELALIAEKMIVDENLQLTGPAREHLLRYLEFVYQLRDKYFGNARTVRNIVLDVIKNHNLRLSRVEVDSLSDRDRREINLKDVSHLKLNKDQLVFTRKAIGFGRK
ncbi:MAG: AAA family ATPase [Saprospirales bacterium]|nr:MAG: AAA family ATPase [Saprospirales bacterium]